MGMARANEVDHLARKADIVSDCAHRLKGVYDKCGVMDGLGRVPELDDLRRIVAQRLLSNLPNRGREREMKYDDAVAKMVEDEYGIARSAWAVSGGYRISLQLKSGVIRLFHGPVYSEWPAHRNGVHMEADDWVVVDLSVQTSG